MAISSTLLPRGTSLIFSFCSGFRVATNLVTCFGCDLAAAHLSPEPIATPSKEPHSRVRPVKAQYSVRASEVTHGSSYAKATRRIDLLKN